MSKYTRSSDLIDQIREKLNAGYSHKETAWELGCSEQYAQNEYEKMKLEKLIAFKAKMKREGVWF